MVEYVIDSIDTGKEVALEPQPESESKPSTNPEPETSVGEPETTISEPEPPAVPETAPEPETTISEPEPPAVPEPETTAEPEPSQEPSPELVLNSCIQSNTVFSEAETFPSYLVDESEEPVATSSFGGSYTFESILDYCAEYGCLHVVYYGDMTDTKMAFATNSTEKITGDDYLNWNTKNFNCAPEQPEECELNNLEIISDTLYSDNFPDILKDENGNLIATLSFGGNMLLADIVNACKRNVCRFIVHYGDDSETTIAFATNSTVKQEGDFQSWYSRPAFCLSGVDLESKPEPESISEPTSSAEPESVSEPDSDTQPHWSTSQPVPTTEPETDTSLNAESIPEPESTPEPTDTSKNEYVPPSDAACDFNTLPFQMDTAYFSASEGFPSGAIIDSNGNMVATEDLGGSYSKNQIFDYCHKNLCKYIVHLGPIDQAGPMLIYATNSSETNFFSNWRSVQTACMSQKKE